MPSKDRAAVQIRRELHRRLKDEANARDLSVSRLAEIAIERGLPRLPPVPSLDDDSETEG